VVIEAKDNDDLFLNESRFVFPLSYTFQAKGFKINDVVDVKRQK
jgi:hypothetical protein